MSEQKRGFSGVKSHSTQDVPKISELVQSLEWPKKAKPVPLRFLREDTLVSMGFHQLKITKKDGNETTLSKPCLAWNPTEHDHDPKKKCPYCELSTFLKINYFANAISRDLQEKVSADTSTYSKSEKKTGFKDSESDSETPVVVVRMPSSVATKLNKFGERNTVKSKKNPKEVKSYSIADHKYGKDVTIEFDMKKSGSDMYEVLPESRTPLTEEEEELLVFNLEEAIKQTVETLDVAKAQAKRLAEVMVDKPKGKAKGDDSDDDEDEDDDGLDDRKSKKPSKKKSKDLDDDLEDDLDDDFDEDEDEKPSKKSKKKPSKDLDDDDDDLDDDLDDEEDEKPSKKSKKKPKHDDDDEDLDDDFDEEDDEKPSKKSKKKPSKNIDEDDLDDDDSDDEDEKPAKKSKKKPSKDLDDDDDDLDGDSDDEEEDEKPSKKSKKKPSKGKKKPKHLDDDDDEDMPF